jgi:TPR repeat protein
MSVRTLLVASIVLFMVGSTEARTTRTQRTPRPLTAADVEHGLKSAVSNARMAALVKQYGVDLELTHAVEAELRSVGATDNLILQISHSRSRIAAKPVRPAAQSVVARAHIPANTTRPHAEMSAKEFLSQAEKYRIGSGAVRNEGRAAELYRKAADMGNAEAETRFAEALFDGRGIARYPDGSRAWLEKAVRQGNPRAECDLGVMLTEGLGTTQDRANGLRHLQAAARLGDGYAEDYLGQLAENGWTGEPSPSEAYMHYLTASEMGSAWGAYNIGRMHERGIGVYQNSSEALRWYMKVASMRGRDSLDQWSDLRSEAVATTGANFRIGDMYAEGNGVPKDTIEAKKWYERGIDMASAGARAGWFTADVYLANAYLQAKGVPLDYGEAMHWMKDSAEHGNRQAQVSLGSMYRDGQGSPQNYGEAMYWYRRAVDQGSALAGWMIGRLYFEGKGVKRDFTEAATWFRKATDEGLPIAQCDLGMMYYRGYGVSRDVATARAWLQKSADRGYVPAKEMLARLDPAADEDLIARPARLQ